MNGSTGNRLAGVVFAGTVLYVLLLGFAALDDLLGWRTRASLLAR